MMKHWRHPLLVWLACVALFATVLPAQAWQCGMTGRIGELTSMCGHAISPATAVPPCCRHCCKPLNLPPSDNNPPTNNHLSVAQSIAGTHAALAQLLNQTHIVTVALPVGTDLITTALAANLSAPAVEPDALRTLFKAAPLPGRSPPLT